MKRIYLLRHAKSDWEAGVASDHERPLARRGVKSARWVGRLLADLGQIPDEIVSSSALRALSTAEVANEAGGWEREIRVESALYGASPQIVLTTVRETPAEADSVLLVGHEPVWSETAGLLIGRAGVRMVTAALARIDADVEDWREVEPGSGELAWLVTPKLLRTRRS